MNVGGFGEEKPIDNEIKNLCDELKASIENKSNEIYDTWEPISYKTQVVAGTNYKVKIKVGDNKFIHAKIFKDLPHNGGQVHVLEVDTRVSENTAL